MSEPSENLTTLEQRLAEHLLATPAPLAYITA